MADVTLTYKGNTIAELSDSGSKTLETAGKYCEANILLEYVKASTEDNLKTTTVTLAQDYATATTTPNTIMGICQTAIGTNNFVVMQKSTSRTADSDKTAMVYAGGLIKALGSALPLTKDIKFIARTNGDAINKDPQLVGSWTYNCKAWSGDVYQVWGWD